MEIRIMDKAKVNKWLNALNDNSYNKAAVLSAILEECTYEELEQIYKRSSSMLKGLLSLSFLKRKSYNQIFENNVRPRREFKEYIGVITYIVKHNAVLINKYIDYKAQVEKKILAGEYNQARQIIDIINKEISYSYWAATSLIKITRLEKGLNECTDVYNKLCENVNGITCQIFYCAYRTSSLDFIVDDLKKVLVPNGKEYSEFVNNFLICHCMPFWDFKEGEWICADTNSSLIDLYNILLTYIPCLNEATINDTNVRYYLKELCTCVKDPYLYKICYLYRIINTPVVNAERNAITETYLKNDYVGVIEKARRYLPDQIDDFEIQSYYIKSLFQQGETISIPEKDSSLIEKIRYYYFSIISHSEDQLTNKRRLLNLCRSQYNLQGIRQLYMMIEGIESHDIYNLYNNAWKHSFYNSPLDVVFYANIDTRIDYIKQVSQYDCFWSRVFDTNQSEFSEELFELSLASKQGDDVFDNLVIRWKSGKIALHLKDAVATFIFDQYLQRELYQEGICFYVDNTLTDRALSIGIRENESLDVLYNNKALIETIPLELSIFAEMTGADPDAIYFMYKRYLKQCGVSKASEIIINGNVKQKYFLENVAVTKVLNLHVLRFKSVRQVMEERSSICSNLYVWFQEKHMNDEISAICRDIKIRELNNQVDESKIFVDVQSIKEHESEEAKTLYDMFATANSQVAYKEIVFGELMNILASQGVPSKYYTIDENGKIKESGSSVEFVNYRKDILKRIFYSVRDQFLFNPKYGLDNYLSTRIRHGTLINQLRNHFEVRNLVTNTTEGTYSINEYWINNQLRLRNNEALQCIQLFESFSKGIDDIITDIKDSFIQVKTEEDTTKDNGCFDFDKKYFSSDIDNLLLKNTLNTFDGCFYAIIDCLWKRTGTCLETMHERLNEAQSKMISLLHTLQKDVIDVIGDGNVRVNDFKDAISYCQNEIQNDFQIVKKWFKRSDYVDFDFTIDQVIDTSIAFISRNNTYMPNPQVNIESNSVLQGRYFGPLYDIFHDILNNALDYEKKHKIRQKWVIDVREESGFMTIAVSNPIRKEDVTSLKQKVKEINESLDEQLYKGKSRGEGNSGCSKIFNAVCYHLGSNDNCYLNEIDENESRFVVKVNIELKPIKK